MATCGDGTGFETTEVMSCASDVSDAGSVHEPADVGSVVYVKIGESSL